jgi:hypothetical protein
MANEYRNANGAAYGILTLSDALFQRTYAHGYINVATIATPKTTIRRAKLTPRLLV